MLTRFPHWADIHRNAHDDTRLGVSLAFVAGAANAGGFLAIGQYTSHMTGIVSGAADSLVLGATGPVIASTAAVSAFILGAMTTALLANLARRQRLHAQFSIPLLIEAALLLLFGLLGANLSQHVLTLVPATVLLLCFLMGLQNAVITKISQARIRTTHVTGLVTDIGIELGKLVYVNAAGRRRQAPVRADRKKLRLHAMLLGSFVGGGVAGAFGFQRFGYAATLPLAVVLGAIALPPLLRDCRTRIRLRARRARHVGE